MKQNFTQRAATQKAYYIVLLLLIISCAAAALTIVMDFTWHGGEQTGVQVIAIDNDPVESADMQIDYAAVIKDYADIVVTVITAIIAALLSITVTVFVFLKSALDRIIDENRYIADVANIYKANTSGQLFVLCVMGFITLALSIVWHFLLSIKESHPECCLWFWIFSLAAALLCNLILSVLFWCKCIRVEDSLQIVIFQECDRLKGELTAQTFMTQKKRECLALIGDWDRWETEGLSQKDLEKCGIELCQTMTSDQFINLFVRTEILLLAGERGRDSREPSDSDILTVLQERANILNPNSKIENQDLKDRRYPGNRKDSKPVTGYIIDFEEKVGYSRENKDGKNAFFEDTKELYSILEQYRNLLISWKFTITKGKAGKKDGKPPEENTDHPENGHTRTIFAQGLYFFFLRILAVFVSALHISDFSFNGFTLNFANFYSSTLEDVSLYSSEFYHTIFARAQLVRAVMDISHFDSVDFYNTKITDSTLNNANFEHVRFDSAQIGNVGLSSCTFQNCQMNHSDFENCVLNNSEFISCQLSSVNFHNAKMRGIVWEKDVTIDTCSFQGADIRDWTWPDGRTELSNCDFSGSTWSQERIQNGTLTGSDFSKAVLTGITFRDTDLRAVLFLQCNLAEAKFQNCEMDQASLEKALLFDVKFCNVKLRMANLFQASAVKARFEACDLTNSDCADADFSEGSFLKTNLHATRLYDCSLTKARFTGCECDYLLADHVQFTFAKCANSQFRYGSLSDSNLTESFFQSCEFNGSDLTKLNATKVQFNDCRLLDVNFSETRFTKANLVGDQCHIIKNCNFSNCQFENVLFSRIEFQNCIFKNALFIDCTAETEKIGSFMLTEESFSRISDGKCDVSSIIWH